MRTKPECIVVKLFPNCLTKCFTHNNCRGGKLFHTALLGSSDDLITKLTQNRLIGEKLNFNFVFMGTHRNRRLKVTKTGSF